MDGDQHAPGGILTPKLLDVASHFVGWVKSFIEEELGVALAPTTGLNEVSLREASVKAEQPSQAVKPGYNIQKSRFMSGII